MRQREQHATYTQQQRRMHAIHNRGMQIEWDDRMCSVLYFSFVFGFQSDQRFIRRPSVSQSSAAMRGGSGAASSVSFRRSAPGGRGMEVTHSDQRSRTQSIQRTRKPTDDDDGSSGDSGGGRRLRVVRPWVTSSCDLESCCTLHTARRRAVARVRGLVVVMTHRAVSLLHDNDGGLHGMRVVMHTPSSALQHHHRRR